MKITALTHYRKEIPLTRPYAIASDTCQRETITNIFVELQLENGMVGYGIAAPSQRVTGESVGDCLDALSPAKTEWLYGQDVRCLRALSEQLAQRMPTTPAARAALDIALHDLTAKLIGLPLVDVLGRQQRSLATSITIGIKSPEETLEEAREYLARGFSVLKVKLRGALDEDLARVRLLRETLPSSTRIRVDANQGYTITDLCALLPQLSPLDIEFVEQPLPSSEIAQLAHIPADSDVLLCLDENVVSPQDAYRLSRGPLHRQIFNIKLMKCGGIYAGERLAAVAALADIPLMWGCNDESCISIAAALHLALACPNTRYLDLDGSFDLDGDPFCGGFRLEEGRLVPEDKPGLGVTKC